MTLNGNWRPFADTKTSTEFIKRSMDSHRRLSAVMSRFNVLNSISIPGSHTAKVFFRHRWPRDFRFRQEHLMREYVGVSRWNARGQQKVENTIEALAAVRTHPVDLLNGDIEMLLRERFELPALSTLRRIAGNVVQRVHDRLLLDIQKRLSEQVKLSRPEFS